MSDDDIIKMDTDIHITDSNGNPITVSTIQPEYVTETFNLKPKTNLTNIITKKDDES